MSNADIRSAKERLIESKYSLPAVLRYYVALLYESSKEQTYRGRVALASDRRVDHEMLYTRRFRWDNATNGIPEHDLAPLFQHARLTRHDGIPRIPPYARTWWAVFYGLIGIMRGEVSSTPLHLVDRDTELSEAEMQRELLHPPHDLQKNIGAQYYGEWVRRILDTDEHLILHDVFAYHFEMPLSQLRHRVKHMLDNDLPDMPIPRVPLDMMGAELDYAMQELVQSLKRGGAHGLIGTLMSELGTAFGVGWPAPQLECVRNWARRLYDASSPDKCPATICQDLIEERALLWVSLELSQRRSAAYFEDLAPGQPLQAANPRTASANRGSRDGSSIILTPYTDYRGD